MHSYLLVGNESKGIDREIDKLTKKLNLSPLEYILAKISDVRELGSFTKLRINKPTAIIINNIDNATIETLNAFLKNLEEPQKNLTYILTTSSIHALLPTIVSRCQIIKARNREQGIENREVSKDFLKLSTSEKLIEISNIKAREEAVLFIKELTLGIHTLLHSNEPSLKLAKSLKTANRTIKNLKANGNVQLQLTNFVLNLA